MTSAMNQQFTYTIKRTLFDENYNPSGKCAYYNQLCYLARGENRQENLRNTLAMINNRFNNLAHWDNPKGDRYAVRAGNYFSRMKFNATGDTFQY